MESLQPKKKHGCLISIAVFIVAIAVIGGIASALTPSTKTVAAPGSSSVSAAPESAPTKIGTAIDNGEISIKINSVKEMDSINDNSLVYKPDDGGKFIVINLTAKNTGKELYSFVVTNFQIKSSDGKQYSPSTIFTVGNEYLNSGSINPGLSKTGIIAFDAPKDVKLSTLTLEFQKFWSLDTAEFSLSSK